MDGQKLEDARSLNHYGTKNESTVYLILKVKSGAWDKTSGRSGE